MPNEKHTIGRYVDINTDFGWKFYFGREEHKDLLIRFLNDIFEGEKDILDLVYVPSEHDGAYQEDRRAIFDLHCIAVDGTHFIIEMQHLYQDFFKDRALFYTARLISKQLKKGKSGDSYLLPEIYFIGILEFSLNDTNSEQYFVNVALMDKINKELFYSKLGFKFIILPHFTKKEDELKSYMDQWLFLLKHLSSMRHMSKFLDKRVFARIFDIGQVAKLKREDQMSYEASFKQKMDWNSILATTKRMGREEGIEEGIEQGQRELAKNYIEKFMIETDWSDEEIAQFSGVAMDIIRQIREDLKSR